MSVYLGRNKVDITKFENLDTELNEQEELLDELETQVNELSDKPKDMLQERVDKTNSCDYLFYEYNGEELDISRLDTSNVASMRNMFQYCEELKSVDLSHLDTRNVKDMYGVFYHCDVLTDVNTSGWDTSACENMQYMFTACLAITSLDLTHFDISKVKTLFGTFQQCKNLTNLNVSNWDTSACETMRAMFYICQRLLSIDLSSFNTSNVTEMCYMFKDMYKIPLIDISNFDTRKVKDTTYMFSECRELVQILGSIDMVSVVNAGSMFTNCYKLTDVTLKNIKTALQIGSGTTYGHLLTLDSLLNTIKELWNMTGSSSKTLTVGSANLEKLANVYVKLIDITDEMRAEDEYIDNKLPFVQCESTDAGAMLISEYATSKNWQLA